MASTPLRHVVAARSTFAAESLRIGASWPSIFALVQDAHSQPQLTGPSRLSPPTVTSWGNRSRNSVEADVSRGAAASFPSSTQAQRQLPLLPPITADPLTGDFISEQASPRILSIEKEATIQGPMPWTAPLLRSSAAATVSRGGALVTSLRGMATGPKHQAVAEEVEGARYLTKVTTGAEGKHSFFSDLAYEDGDGDTAPAPMDYAVSSVALCTTMTLRLYAERKGWGLARIRVEAQEDRTKGAGHIPDGLILTIHLEGDLTEEQRQRLLEIAGKCPVKSIMLGKMPKGIRTEQAPKSPE